MEHTLSFARRIATAVFISLLILALFLLIGYAANFFFLVFGGIVVAVVISALSHFVSDRTPLSYGLSVVLVLLLLVVLVGGTVWLLAPTVSQQADEHMKCFIPLGVSLR